MTHDNFGPYRWADTTRPDPHPVGRAVAALVTTVVLVALALAVGGCEFTSYETTIEQICPQGGMGVKTEVRTRFYGHAVHRARVKDAAAKALAECADVVPQAPAKRPRVGG